MDMKDTDQNKSSPSQNIKDNVEFIPPRHWLGPEELESSYWDDAKVKEKRSQEFHDKPIELIDQIDRMDSQGIARRDFLTVMGASIAMATVSCVRRPVHKIIPHVVVPEEITLGVPTWYASTCQECSTGCGTLVKNREGRPIKLEGNPDHPINRGALCARGQASLLGLYDPERLKSPISRVRARNASRKEISWDVADVAIQSELKKVAMKGGKIRVLTGHITSHSSTRLIKEFLSAFSEGKQIEFEPLSIESIPQAQELSYGKSSLPTYHFDKADFVLSLGADFIGTWLSPVEYSQAWSKKRKLMGQTAAKAQMSQMICFESTMTLTGANADLRYPIRSGDEFKIAAALIHELVVERKNSSIPLEASTVTKLKAYTPEIVAEEIGMHEGAKVIRQVANHLWENRGKSLVVGGGISSQTENALALQVAINFLNSILGNDGVTLDSEMGSRGLQGGVSEVVQLISEINSGKVDALIIYHSNPVYHLPQLKLSEALKRVPLVISISDREDETGLLADYVLPDHHPLENWGDANPKAGLYSVQQPTIAPLHLTRAFQDSLLKWSKNVGLKVSGIASRVQDWHQYIQENWKETLYKSVAGSPATFEQFWDSILRKGVFETLKKRSAGHSSRSFKTSSLSVFPQYQSANKEDIFLGLYSKVSMGDGKSSNNAWIQEMPDPITSVTWDNYLNVGPQLASELKLKSNDVVKVQSDGISVELPVHIQPGMHPRAVSAAVGYGRTSVGKVGNGAGSDVFPFGTIQNENLVFSGKPVKIAKTGRFYNLASTQWHTATEDRPIINDITLSEFRKNPAHASHTDPHLRMNPVPSIWPSHEYKGYRWGMAIDLNSCTGCGACTIACQAENNIPVVGRNQVRVSRQMHWIRIDRYYAGSPNNPEMIFQPMLCQHCENAPCETVCPVLATVHDDEGLNSQIYNRCVGTRYCQNNCPYKVRRFNFFDHWKSYESTMNLAWNPDVTVRTRGIMEKCTFCIQRIRVAKEHAKDAGEKVKDGDFQTACQQTCPTQAIVFGDMNDPKSLVSQMKESPQAFRVLEILNTKPSVSYMTKVRNRPEGVHHS